jgi:hypothetical protein
MAFNHVWSDGFDEDRTHEGGKYRMLNIVDEFTHECLAIRIDRRLNSTDVIDALSDLFILGSRGLRPGARRASAFVTNNSAAARAGPKTVNKLTFLAGHSVKADHSHHTPGDVETDFKAHQC